MDGSDEDIIIDENGVCNHCLNAQRALIECEKEKENLPKIIERIKKDGEYDWLIGLLNYARMKYEEIRFSKRA